MKPFLHPTVIVPLYSMDQTSRHTISFTIYFKHEINALLRIPLRNIIRTTYRVSLFVKTRDISIDGQVKRTKKELAVLNKENILFV